MNKTPNDEAAAISRALVANPYYAVNFHPGLSGAHKASVTEAQWIEIEMHFGLPSDSR